MQYNAYTLNKAVKTMQSILPLKATLNPQELIILEMLEQGEVPCKIGDKLNISFDETYDLITKVANFINSEDDVSVSELVSSFE